MTASQRETSPDDAISVREARTILAAATALRQAADTLATITTDLSAQLHNEHERLRRALIVQHLSDLPVDELRPYTDKPLRGLRLVREAGYPSVQAVLTAAPHQLQSIRGIGEPTALAIIKAATMAQEAVEHDTTVRFNADAPTPGHTALLRHLRALISATRIVAGTVQPREQLKRDLHRTLAQAKPAASRWRRWFSAPVKITVAHQALREIAGICDGTDAAVVHAGLVDIDAALNEAARVPDGILWDDYARAAATYQALLAEIRGDDAASSDAATGYIPPDVANQANQVTLDRRLLTVRLRAYQAFGAQYVLSRPAAIIGDEMGLGKTIEAIAVMAHLAARNERRCLVVVPAGVLFNWIDEVANHSELTAVKIHGPDREETVRRWVAGGGIAVTTYQTLVNTTLPAMPRLDLLVVDEAHMIKNPDRARSRRIAGLCWHARRVLLMTGTPMENRVSEFRNLVAYLNPELARSLLPHDRAVIDATQFRHRVAPVYLRRNQQDVLKELPELVEVDDWLELGPAEYHLYRDAVVRRHFPDMRRAAYLGTLHPPPPAKIERLREIVAEAADNGRKVLIFSFFHDVINQITDSLNPASVFSLQRGIDATRRSQAITAFTAHNGHAVLIGQIDALGIGVNIQAASVVVLTEPQLKPSTEWQAIRRSYRMGQPRMVQVHRLLAKDSVDERLEELLREKRRLFYAYAHQSEAKNADPSAIDSGFLNDEISESVQNEIIDIEAHRLRLT
jgi:superfamily II DNA or RNA helicase